MSPTHVVLRGALRWGILQQGAGHSKRLGPGTHFGVRKGECPTDGILILIAGLLLLPGLTD